MKIKNILSVCLVCFGFTVALTSCSHDEEAFYSVSDEDSPRILNTDFEHENPDDSDSPIVFKIKRNQNLNFSILVTPADMTTIKWLLDGEQIHEGVSIDKGGFEAGNYVLRILAVTVKGKQTYRDCKFTVEALDNDPVGGTDIMERFQEAGAAVTLSGSRMSTIKQIKINNRLIDVTSAADDKIQYTIPADMPEGSYRVSLIDAEGVSYGGGVVNVSGQSIVNSSSFIGGTPGNVTIYGRKLDNVTAVTVDGQACTIVSQQVDQMVIGLPSLSDGTYSLKATTKSGAAMMFIKEGALVDAATMMVAHTIANQSSFLGLSAGRVNITGTNLNDVASVTVDGKPCTIVTKNAGNMVVQLPELEEGTFDLKATTTSGTTVKFVKSGQLVEVASIKVSTIAEDILWEGSWAVDWSSSWNDDGTVTTELKKVAKVRAILRLYVTRTASDYAIGCAAVDWADIVKGGKDDARGDKNINPEDAYIDFELTKKSLELINSGNLQVVGHGFEVNKITIIQPSEEELWSGSWAIDWDTSWNDDSTVTEVLKTKAGVGSVLRLYVSRTATDYAIGCAAVGWADIIKGGKDDARGDVTINPEDNVIEFTLTEKSFELLSGGNLQVVGHGFDLLKITIQ